MTEAASSMSSWSDQPGRGALEDGEVELAVAVEVGDRQRLDRAVQFAA